MVGASLGEVPGIAGPALPASLPGGVPAQVPLLRLVLLGRMEAWGLASTSVLPRHRKTRALLGILGLAAGSPVLRRRISGLLWSRSGDTQRRGSLRQALHELQESLGDAASLLHVDRETATLESNGVWVDAIECVRPNAGGSSAVLAVLERGAVLLADLEGIDPIFDTWLADQRQQLHERVTRLLSQRRPLDFESRQDGPNRALLAFPTNATNRPPASVPTPLPVRRGGTRLGVLPLRPLGGGVPAHLAVGLAEAVTEALACFRWIFVADCASLAAAMVVGPEASELSSARSMGLDFILTGTFQAGAAPGRIRITFRLTDLRDGAGEVVWAERFDREATDLLALQDAVAAEVVARMDPEILLIEAGRATTAAAAGPGGADAASAHDLQLRAVAAIHRLDRASFFDAGRWLAEAARLDPDHAAIQAWHAYWHLFLVGQGWAEHEDAAMQEAERLAARAVALDPKDAQGLTILGHVRAFLHHRVEEALALHRRALSMNPNLSMAWVFLGMAESYAGAHEAALLRLNRYRELAPCHPHAFFFDAAWGIPLLLLGRHAEAVEVGRATTALQPGLSYPYKTYLSALGHLGLAEEASAVRARLLSIEPDFSVTKALRRTPVRRETDRAHYEEGLRLAGLD